MAKRYDYRALKDQFVAADDLSIRELGRLHGVTENRINSIHVMAKKEDWVGEREKRMARSDEKTIEKIADRDSDRRVRRMEVMDHGLELIDEAIQKLRDDMKATKKEKDPETSAWLEVPAVRYRPSEVVQLMDRLKDWFGDAPASEPTRSEERFFALSASLDGADPEQRALIAGLAGLARGHAGPSDSKRVGGSALPSAPGSSPD